jgi:hypothetical protein
MISYQFFFQACDIGPYCDSKDFIIEVTDVNNHYPVFVFPNATTTLRFNIAVSLFTFKLQTQTHDRRFSVMTTKIRLGNKGRNINPLCFLLRDSPASVV